MSCFYKYKLLAFGGLIYLYILIQLLLRLLQQQQLILFTKNKSKGRKISLQLCKLLQ